MNIQGWFPLGLTSLISLQFKGLKSLLQHHSSKASILWLSAFFMVQFSHPYMTTGKTIALTIQIFVGKVMSLLFNILSRFVIAFLDIQEILAEWIHEKRRERKKSKILCIFSKKTSPAGTAVPSSSPFLTFFSLPLTLFLLETGTSLPLQALF